jgi:hypothetical protein
MNRTIFWNLSLTLSLSGLLLTGLAACDSDDGGDGGGSSQAEPADFSSVGGSDGSVQDNTEVRALSPDQRTALCMEFSEYFAGQFTEAELKNFSCTLAGIFTAAFGSPDGQPNPQLCEQARQECLAAPAEDDGTGDANCDDTAFDESCAATVGELEACAQEQVQALKDASRALSCNLSADAEVSVPGLSDEMGPACAALEQKCPGIFEDDDASNNGFTNNGSINNGSTNNGADE